MRALAEAGVWCGAVMSPEEVLSNEHLAAREMIVDVDDPARGNYQMIGCPVKLEKSPVDVKPAPLYSEHTDDILTGLLDVSPRRAARASETRSDCLVQDGHFQ